MTIDWNKPCRDINANTQNIVVVANWKHIIDLDITHKYWDKSQFVPKKIPCVRAHFNFKHDNTVALIYKSGKVVITGFKQMNTLHVAINILNQFFKKFLNLKHNMNINTKTVNVVANTNILQYIDIQHLNDTTLDTQVFPAAQHKTQHKNKATILIYNNGKIVVAGAKKQFLANLALQFATFNLLEQYRIDRFNQHFYNENDPHYDYTLAEN